MSIATSKLTHSMLQLLLKIYISKVWIFLVNINVFCLTLYITGRLYWKCAINIYACLRLQMYSVRQFAPCAFNASVHMHLCRFE